MTIEQIQKEIKRIGWDSKHVDASDGQYIRALVELKPVRWGTFADSLEKEIGIQLQTTGSGKVIAISLASGYKTAPLADSRAALGRLRANLKTAEVLDKVFPQR